MFVYEHLEMNDAVLLKKKGATFTVLTEEAFNTLCQQANQKRQKVMVVGTTKFKKAAEDTSDALYVQGIHFSTILPTTKSVKYYVPVKSDNPSELWFVTVKKGSLLPFFLIPLLLIGAGITVLVATTGKNPLDVEQGQAISDKKTVVSEQELEYTRFPGYADLTLSKKNPYVYLINPETNTVYMKYSIYDEKDNLLYKTKPIAVGREVEADFVSFLDKGTHELTFVQSTYDVETEQECNGATTKVKVTVN